MLMLRHGESTWNAVRRWQGQADPPLSERGEQQAIAAGEALRSHGPFDLIVTSSLRRARRTGELLAAAAATELGDAFEAFAERAAGPWEGLTRAEIETAYPGFLADGHRPPGYEDDASLLARALPALDALARRHRGGRIVVVTHGGVLNALERHVDRASGREWRRIDNLEGRWFRHRDSRVAVDGPRIRLLDPTVFAPVGEPDAVAPVGEPDGA